jgi:hypothetical protein
MTEVMSIMLVLMIGSPGEQCFQAGKDDGRNSGFSQSE